MKFLILISIVLLCGCASKTPEVQITTGSTVPQNSTAPSHIDEAILLQNITIIPNQTTNDVMMSNTTFPEPPKFNFSNITTPDGRLIIYYFYSPYCEAAKEIRPEITKLETRYRNMLWLEYDITTQNGTLAYMEFATEYNLSTKQRLVPQALVNGTIITDRFNINKSLEEIIVSFKTT